MNRINKILVGALLFQVVLVFVMRLGGDKTAVRELTPLLAEFDPARVTRLRLFRQDDTPAGAREEKLVVDLKRKDKEWVLSNYTDYPAAGKRVDDLLNQLKETKVRGSMTEDKERHPQLEVAEERYHRKLVFEVDGKETVLYLGVNPGQSSQKPVRIGSGAVVYGVSNLSEESLGGSVRSWVELDYLKLPQTSIASVSVTSAANGTMEITRDGDKWKVTHNGTALPTAKDKSIDESMIDAVLQQASYIELDEPALPRELDNAVTVSVRMQPKPGDSNPNGEEHHLDIAPDSKERVYVRRRGFAPVLVEAPGVENLMKLSPGTIVRNAGAPTPGPNVPPAPDPTEDDLEDQFQ